MLAEFWADGPSSETPPGHWNTLANYVSDHPLVERIGGRGPISATRYMGGLGQSATPALPVYHPDGLPLVPGLVEVITRDTTAPGARHYDLEGHEGGIAIITWPGQPGDVEHEFSGAKWQRAVAWAPYQRNTFVTPPFAGHVSGHSTFSRAGAEVLTEFTGSKYFPGGWERSVRHGTIFATSRLARPRISCCNGHRSTMPRMRRAFRDYGEEFTWRWMIGVAWILVRGSARTPGRWRSDTTAA